MLGAMYYNLFMHNFFFYDFRLAKLEAKYVNLSAWRFSKPPNGTMKYRRTSTMASRRIPSMERGRIHLFSMEDGRIPSFNAFLTKNVLTLFSHKERVYFFRALTWKWVKIYEM